MNPLNRSLTAIFFLFYFTFSYGQTISITNSTTNTSCDGNAELDSLTPGFNTRWFILDSIANATVIQTGGDTIANLCPGHYKVIVDSAFFFQYEHLFVIESDSDPCANPIYISDDNCDPSGPAVCNGFLNPQGTMGHPPYSYLWSTGDTVNHIYLLCEGSYTLTVTDSIGCQATKTFYLDGFTAELDLTHNIQPGDCIGSAQTTIVDNETSDFIYTWSHGNETFPPTTGITDLCSGIYNLLVQRTATYNGGSHQYFVISDSSTTYGYLPYGDSLVIDTLSSTFEDCLFDYTSLDSAYLANASIYNDSNLVVTWNVMTDNGTYQYIDTIHFDNNSGVYNLVVSVYCEEFKSTEHFFTINGQMYIDPSGQIYLNDQEQMLNPVLGVHPNPFHDKLVVSLIRKADYTIELIDASARSILTDTFIQSSSLDIQIPESLSPGAYFLKVSSHGHSQTIKVLH